MKKLISKKGFTLVETIVSGIIISVVSATAFFSIVSLRKVDDITLNRVTAVNLIRLSQEEVRRIGQTGFDNLGQGTCNFNNGNTCGFKDIDTIFPGFTRTLTVVNEAGDAELKRILINIAWTESGRAQELNSVILFSRPPGLLPGNLIGLVTVESGPTEDDLIEGVQITLSDIAGTGLTYVAGSVADVIQRGDGLITNYTFSEGPFIIEPGSYFLTATHSGFQNYPDGAPVIVLITSNSELTFDFQMEPNPEDGHIIVQFLSGGNPVFVNNNSNVFLYDDGSERERLRNRNIFNFTIPFTDLNPQSFTVKTEYLYRSGFVGDFNCVPPQTHDARGWSSAVVGPLPASCANPWNGNVVTDRITVTPGVTVTENAVVVPVPTATVQGRVEDQNGIPIANARIYARYPNNRNYTFPGGILFTTGSDGEYSVTVPAAQALFEDTLGNYVRIWARAQVPITRCCQETSMVWKDSARSGPLQRVGPLYEGNILSKDLVIDTTPIVKDCGDAHGTVREDRYGGVLSGVSVRLDGQTRLSDGTGRYLFDCSGGPGYRISVGEPTLIARRNGFYEFRSTGNSRYSRQTPFTTIESSIPNLVKETRMWPVGQGTIIVNVTVAGSTAPIAGAEVQLVSPRLGGLNETLFTNAAGVVQFENIIESWPSPNLPDNGKYNTNSRLHNINVIFTDQYGTASVNDFTLDDGETKTLDVELIPDGAM